MARLCLKVTNSHMMSGLFGLYKIEIQIVFNCRLDVSSHSRLCMTRKRVNTIFQQARMFLFKLTNKKSATGVRVTKNGHRNNICVGCSGGGGGWR